MNPATTAPEHDWLRRLAGEWRIATECKMRPDEPSVRGEGSESAAMLKPYWLVGDNRLPTPDGRVMTGRITLGYDPRRSLFLGTYVADLMPEWFLYEGRLDADRRTLTLDTSAVDCTDESRTASYQDIIELTGDDTRRFTSRMKQPDGSWVVMMTGEYTRR